MIETRMLVFLLRKSLAIFEADRSIFYEDFKN